MEQGTPRAFALVATKFLLVLTRESPVPEVGDVPPGSLRLRSGGGSGSGQGSGGMEKLRKG